MYEYRAQILRVVDADTVHAEVDLGFDVRERMMLRLFGINAPELSTNAGKVAKEFLVELLGLLPAPVTIRTEKDRREKYGRYLATIILADGRFVNSILVAEGHAVTYLP